MARMYNFEPDIAKQSERGQFIEKPGIYTGKFTAAWYEQSRTGAECIKFKFIDEHGNQANNLSIYTHRGNGETLSGYRLLQKIMACMRVKNLAIRNDTVEVFDYQTKSMQRKQCEIYPGLYGPIGLVLITEEYAGRHETKQQLIIRTVFEAQTKLMAEEIMAQQTTPTALEEVTRRMTEKNQWHKPLETHKNRAQKTPPQPQEENHFSDDDVPF